jgi:hypothetical protein
MDANSWKEILGPDTVIHSYSDADAVSDGVLVPYTGGLMTNGTYVNRVTAAVWSAYTDRDRFLVDATELSKLVDEIREKGRVDDGWMIYEKEGTRFWIVPNGGETRTGVPTSTLMFPGDY